MTLTEIVQALYDLYNDEVGDMMRNALKAFGTFPARLTSHLASPQYSKKAIVTAMSVLQACSPQDLSTLTGEIVPDRFGKWTFVCHKGRTAPEEMVIIARSLMAHGVIGKAQVRKLQRHEGAQTSSEFNAFEYISAARTYPGMSREEA